MAEPSWAEVGVFVVSCVSIPLSIWAVFIARKAAKSDRLNTLLMLREHYVERANAMQNTTNLSVVPSEKESAADDGKEYLGRLKLIKEEIDLSYKDLMK